MEPKKTSLYQKHLNLKAKMAPFAGFEMPLQYSSPKEEVLAVRQSLGIFDVSHMGEFFVEGPQAVEFVDYLITNDFAGAGVNKAVYSPLCRENGTVVDDLIAYRIGEQKILICVNASNIEKDWNWIKEASTSFDCQLTNQSEDYSLIAVQGPKVEEYFTKLGLQDSIKLPYYGVMATQYNGQEVITSRTGYTGEDGFEVFCSHEIANQLWDQLIDNGATPCGLVSRDVLRLEVCFPLYGNELSDNWTPLDSALKWAVKLDKPKFIGKEALADYKPNYRLVKLIMQKGIPRENYTVHNQAGDKVGYVTSGTLSVTTGQGIALCQIEKSKMPSDKKFFIQIRKNLIEANYSKKPFVSGGHK